MKKRWLRNWIGTPDPAVDPVWYLARYPDVAETGSDPVQHYLEFGRAEGRFPNAKAASRHLRKVHKDLFALVDPVWYLAQYPEIAAAGVDPAEHYVLSGRTEGRFPNAKALSRHVREVHKDLIVLVDPAWYLAQYPEIAAAGVDPAEHYALSGHKEGRFPNAEAASRHVREVHKDLIALVDPVWYLAQYPEIAAAGADPAEHYALSGHREGRFPNAEAAARFAREAHKDLFNSVDPDWYLVCYPDVANAGIDPAEHYALSGHREGRFPNAEAASRYVREVHKDLIALVDPGWYLAHYPDVAAAGVDPVEHYALSGHQEGRFPNAEEVGRRSLKRQVDPDWYAARYPDVAESGLDPAEHFVLRGHAEGRIPNPHRIPVAGWGVPAAEVPTARPLTRYPLVGIVTPVRNRRTWSVGFAQMLDRQDYPMFRLYAVDSQSTDGTPEALRALNFPWVELLAAPDSAYWTAATNVGVAQALADGCDFVLTVNDDAIIPPEFLTTIVRSAVQAQARIVGSVIAFADTPGRIWGVGAYNKWETGAFVQTAMAMKWDDALSEVERSPEGLMRADYLCGNGTLVHRSVFEEIGLYDVKSLPHYHADSEFTMRAEKTGIDRWICLEAKLYNRFSEVGEGIFSPRNQRLFSFRSANYARPLVFIVDRYCPPAVKAQALVLYFARHVRNPSGRTWSRLLRIIRFIETPEAERRVSRKDFFPPLDPARCAAEDVDILLGLPDTAFLAALYPILLRRLPTEDEQKWHAAAIRKGQDRRDIVRALLSRPEVRFAEGGHAALLLTSIEHADPMATPPDGVAGRQARTDALTVHMCIDVLCMAVTDPKAATGVHRYVLNIMQELQNNDRIDLRLFHAAELTDSANVLRKTLLSGAEMTPPGQRATEGLVFYPYFPFAGRDTRFVGLPQVSTLCDLFPLTNPDWFSSAAVVGFRRQLRGLVEADHILCISAATEAALKATLPSLSATSSVAHLGVRSLARDTGDAATADRRADATNYFICVGTIEPRKNLRSVIAAMRHLRAPGVRDLRMLVVGQAGWSITAADLTGLAGEDSGRISFLGRVSDDELWNLYLGAVCTVFPSLAEGFGFPIVEAFSCGTPVVTSNGSSMAEIADRGALLVDPTDPASIAGAVERLATDPALRTRLAGEALERSRHFTWAACAARHVDEFERLIARLDSATQRVG